jgi:hypothetical protein
VLGLNCSPIRFLGLVNKKRKKEKEKNEVQISIQLLLKKHSNFLYKALQMFGSDFAVSKSCP